MTAMGAMTIREDSKKWSVVFGLYMIASIAFGVQRIFLYAPDKSSFNTAYLLIDQAGFTVVWGVLTVFILWLTKKLRESPQPWPLSGFTLFGGGIVFSVVHAVLYLFYIYIATMILEPSENIRSLDVANQLFKLNFAWRFLSYCMLVLLSYLYDYYFLFLERERKAARLQAQLAISELQALKMQLSPHFLFNTLHAILVLIKEDPQAASNAVLNLSDLLRITLEDEGTQEVSLSKELEFLKPYLQIQKIRFQDRLTVNVNFDADTLNAKVPYLIFQPLVENAIKHGIERRLGPGRIEVISKRENGNLLLSVTDNGPGIVAGGAPARQGGIGLSNTRSRLQQLYQDNHRIELSNLREGGFNATVVIPYRLYDRETQTTIH